MIDQHDQYLMYQQEQWEQKHNWLSFTLGVESPFTRSNGTVLARVYERLTKASRRRDATYEDMEPIVETAYRRGVYDAFQALQKELDKIAEECAVIVATYKKMSTGTDIPRLNGGIEAMPVADGRQAIGRPRRLHPGKEDAIWISIADKNMYSGSGVEFLYGYTKARLKGYREKGATIKTLKKEPTK